MKRETKYTWPMIQNWSFKALLCGSLLFALACPVLAQQIEPPKLDAATEKRLSIPRLTGDELLCEIETEDYSGIFALDTKLPNPLPFPLVRGASSPQWGPQHKVFSFFRAGLVWVGDCEGRIQPAGLIPRNAQNFRLQWDPSGRVFAIYDVPGWTRIFARGINFREDFAVERLRERRRINLKFSEMIILKVEANGKSRSLPIEEGIPPVTTLLPLSAKVRATQAVDFSPDAARFVMQVNDGSASFTANSHLWLFKTISNDHKATGFSREQYDKTIADNDYSRFYFENSLAPNATFVKELTGQNKTVSETNPIWSPDGEMLAYTQIDAAKEAVWPHVLTGEKLEKDEAISIPGYLPFASERWAKKSVEVLFWAPNGDLFLIESTRDKIYRAKKTQNGFVAAVWLEVVASGQPALLQPVLRDEWVAYTMSLDDAMTIHLKNTRTAEERLLRLAVNGSGYGVIRSVN